MRILIWPYIQDIKQIFKKKNVCSRFQFLHQKLSRIKDAIHDYDESLQINGSEIEQENY